MIRYRNPAVLMAAIAGFVAAGGPWRKGATFAPFTVDPGPPPEPEPPPPVAAAPIPPKTGAREAARRRRQAGKT